MALGLAAAAAVVTLTALLSGSWDGEPSAARPVRPEASANRKLRAELAAAQPQVSIPLVAPAADLSRFDSVFVETIKSGTGFNGATSHLGSIGANRGDPSTRRSLLFSQFRGYGPRRGVAAELVGIGGNAGSLERLDNSPELAYSLVWMSGAVRYELLSMNLSRDQLLEVARSMRPLRDDG